MSELYHDKNPKFGLNETERVWPDDFDLIAWINSDDLDLVFEQTNNVDKSWTDNPGVKVVRKNPRSTSVGDVIVTSKDIVYICLPIGWKNLGPGDRKITIPVHLGLGMEDDGKTSEVV
jgi:hypothetical protein